MQLKRRRLGTMWLDYEHCGFTLFVPGEEILDLSEFVGQSSYIATDRGEIHSLATFDSTPDVFASCELSMRDMSLFGEPLLR